MTGPARAAVRIRNGRYIADNRDTAFSGGHGPNMFFPATETWVELLREDAPFYPVIEVKDGHIVRAIDTDGTLWAAPS